MTNTTAHHSNEQAQRIAEAVASAWYGNANHATERLDIALGALASAALIRMDVSAGHALADRWEQLDDQQLLEKLGQVWALTWISDPYLIEIACPLHDWISENPDTELLSAARRVISTALRTGLLEQTGHDNPALRDKADVLGTTLTHMRATGARAALGEYHTPPDIAQLIASNLLHETSDTLPEQGKGFADHIAGTGGLLRVTALSIRHMGGEPSHYRWFMQEINPISAACAAVNAIIWGLGPNVLVYCGNTLTEPDGAQQAATTRRDVLEHHAGIVRAARLLAATRSLTNETAK